MGFFFSPQLILQKSNGQFQRNLSFFKVLEGVQHFPGGVQLLPGGSNCFFPIETHINCDFRGGGGRGPDPLLPPLDPHLVYLQNLLILIIIKGSFTCDHGQSCKKCIENLQENSQIVFK